MFLYKLFGKVEKKLEFSLGFGVGSVFLRQVKTKRFTSKEVRIYLAPNQQNAYLFLKIDFVWWSLTFPKNQYLSLFSLLDSGLQ